MTTVLRHTAWMDSPGVGDRLASPTFELRRLRLDRGPDFLAPGRGKMTVWRRLMRRWRGGSIGPPSREGDA
jgi:hypothetical protein